MTENTPTQKKVFFSFHPSKQKEYPFEKHKKATLMLSVGKLVFRSLQIN